MVVDNKRNLKSTSTNTSGGNTGNSAPTNGSSGNSINNANGRTSTTNGKAGNIAAVNNRKGSNQPAVIEIPPVVTQPPRAENGVEMGQMRTIELSTGRIREGFANGDVIVTLLPINSNMPWITPPVFRPELVPEELMAQGLTVSNRFNVCSWRIVSPPP